MSVAVVDESGTLVSFVTGDATGLHTFETARGKVVTTAALETTRIHRVVGLTASVTMRPRPR